MWGEYVEVRVFDSSSGTVKIEAVPAQVLVRPPYKIVERQALSTYSELVNEISYPVDNSHSNVELERGIKITKSIERQSRVDIEQSAKQSASSKVVVGVPHVSAEVAGQVEAACRSLLSESVTKTHSVEDTVNVRVPPRTVCNVTVRWMRIWERGEIILVHDSKIHLFEGQDSDELVVPYRESIDLIPDVRVT
jgi:hypothetical protein